MTDQRHPDVLVVGAGFAGIYMLHRLRDTGLTATVLEAGDGVGGTWYWNRYPGARCDSESYYYSYSFDEDLQQEWDWSERYAGQTEILRYLDHVADRFDLRRDIVLGARVVAATRDGASGRWVVETAHGGRWTARYLVTAVGCLSSANVPDLPGLETFGGEWYHTGQWPHTGVDFTGARVGIVGTGSTGIQAIPVIAEQAAHLTVFQRTPNYSIPARNGPMSDDERRQIKADYAGIRAVQRATTNGHPFLPTDRDALSVTAEEREKTYRDAWEAGGLRFRATFRDLLADQAANDTASDFIRERIREVVDDPATAHGLLPDDHGFATKRPPIDTGYFETYNLAHVDLVDVRADPIREVTRDGVRLASGAEHRLDRLVFATGFDALTGPLLRMNIHGDDGVALADRWAEGPRTYLGLQVAGFPNLFTITGPGSPSVLTNMPTAIEQHVDWIVGCLRHMARRGHTRVGTTVAAEEEWGAEVAAAADRTLLPRARTSWYLGANVPGKPRVFMPYAGGMAHYAEICAGVVERDYEGFVFS